MPRLPMPPDTEGFSEETRAVRAQHRCKPQPPATIGAHGPAALPADGVLAARTWRQQDQETVTWRRRAGTGGDAGGAAPRRLGQMTGHAPEGVTPRRAGQPTGNARWEALGRCGRHLADTSGTLHAEAVSASKAAGSGGAGGWLPVAWGERCR